MKVSNKEHVIKNIVEGSIAEECGIEAGDILVAIDGSFIEDIFDYQYLCESDELELLIKDNEGNECIFEIEKDEDEDLGLVFEEGLMDEYHSCKNKCIFCFIDQMPEGMRDTLYFKDDDSRLSFLQGNYITLTGLSDHDVERIIKYHLAPINISFHTVDPVLRCEMLHNRFAGEALSIVDRFYDAGIEMNGQIVLCRGINDGAKLEESIEKLSGYIPHLGSLSVVPVGLTKYRDGLCHLEPFDRESAGEVIDIIEKWQKIIYEKYGINFVHGGDEWYIMAGRDVPQESSYDGYLQLENGVGMLRLFKDEFNEALSHAFDDAEYNDDINISIATGHLMYPYIRDMADSMVMAARNNSIKLTLIVYEIINNFFGEKITVSGLLTGQDIIAQLKGKDLGDKLLLPENILRAGEDVLLDDITVGDMERELGVKIQIVGQPGECLVEAVFG